MIVKTKKYQLDTNTYLKLGLTYVAKKWWWAWLIPVAIMLIPIAYSPAFWWCFGIALTLTILYILFWVIQFTGITQMEQYKLLFDKMNYEISSQHILMKKNAREGMPIKWDQIQEVKVSKDAYTFVISMAQFVHLPFNVFKSDRDLKFMEVLLRRKGLLPSNQAEQATA